MKENQRTIPYFLAWSLILVLTLAIWQTAVADNSPPTTITSNVACENGLAGIYPCENVNLLAHIPLDAIGAEDDTIKGNDHWGWTDLETGNDYVIFGLSNGTTFIDITDRANPIYLGKLMNEDAPLVSVWRDIKVYDNHAFIAGDIPTNDGLQVFDLTQLRNVTNPPVTFTADAHYDLFGPGHNLWINEASGYLYVFRSDTCNGGIHMVNIQDPLTPAFAGCFAENDVPLSDSECVMYTGPDTDYTDREICFIGSDDNVSIGDVTDKAAPTMIANFDYNGIVRAHQGSLTPDQRYWLLSDTMDEMQNGHNTRTYVIDVQDLDAPVILGVYEHDTTARDHNVYIIGDTAYQSNWRAGLRILDISGLPDTNFSETGYFDIVPDSDSVAISGAWSNYPWWSDGVVTISGTDEGLFVLQPVTTPTDVALNRFAGAQTTSHVPWIFIITLLLVGAIWVGYRRLRYQA